MWYNIYKDTMEKEVFVLNPYDKCTANKLSMANSVPSNVMRTTIKLHESVRT